MKHPELKIIISSATLEVEKFSRFFNDAPAFFITGRGYDVELVHEVSHDYLEQAFTTIVKIHESSEEANGNLFHQFRKDFILFSIFNLFQEIF